MKTTLRQRMISLVTFAASLALAAPLAGCMMDVEETAEEPTYAAGAALGAETMGGTELIAEMGYVVDEDGFVLIGGQYVVDQEGYLIDEVTYLELVDLGATIDAGTAPLALQTTLKAPPDLGPGGMVPLADASSDPQFPDDEGSESASDYAPMGLTTKADDTEEERSDGDDPDPTPWIVNKVNAPTSFFDE